MRVATVALLVSISFPLLFVAQSPAHSQARETFSSGQQTTQRLAQIREALDSFRRLTELLRTYAHSPEDPKASFARPAVPRKARYSLSAEDVDLLSVGNLDWDVQTIGFQNWADVIAGHLLFQNQEIARLELQNAELRGASAAEIKEARQRLDEATAKYEKARAAEMAKVE